LAEAQERLGEARDRLRRAEISLGEVEEGGGGGLGQEETRRPPPPASLSSFFPSFAFPWDNPPPRKQKEEEDESRRKERKEKTRSLLSSILDRLAEQDNPPPYRGAVGYPAMLDTREEMFDMSDLPHSSPYEMLLDVIGEQLYSKVVGCVLEPTSLLEGNLVLGGGK
jgi:hypothetical protein